MRACNVGLAAAMALGLAAAGCPAQAADWEGVYQGTLGKAKIIVELYAGQDKSDYKGGYRDASRYSYLPKPRDINLVLKGEGKALTFAETLQEPLRFADEPDSKLLTGAWQLSVAGDKASGTWADPAGKKTLPISLTRVKPVAAQGEANVLDLTYDALWLKTLTFKPEDKAEKGRDKPKAFGPVTVGWVKDSAFGIAFPVLTQFPDKARMDAVNAMLMDVHRKSVSTYRDCKNGVPVDWEDENAGPEIAYQIDYASPSLLGVTESGSVFCGGAHPSNYATPITFDLASQQQIGGRDQLDLKPDGFGRILKLDSKDERIAFENFALERWKAAAAKDKEMGADCATGWIEDAPAGEKDFSLTLRPEGLGIFRTDYPHVASVCLGTDFNPTIIPWAELKPFIKRGQTLLPEAKG